MRTPVTKTIVSSIAVAALLVACGDRPEGPDPFAGIVFYPNEIEATSLYEGDVPLRAWVENYGEQAFAYSGELVVERAGTVIDTLAFGQLGTGAQTGATIPVQEVCSPGQTHPGFTATIAYDPSITADPSEVDVDMANNTSDTLSTSFEVCSAIYERYLEVFCEECVAKVNSLRALEGLSPLGDATSQQKGCSDADAKANYEAGDAHAQYCGQAQNTCPQWYGTFDEILETCIDYQMYQIEKVNYAKNPSGCKDLDFDDGGCGHYVHMTDKENKGYKTVACGVYVTPSGAPYVVTNFFT
jgi:hypothetical protein